MGSRKTNAKKIEKLKSLSEQAMKYKSANKFVKAIEGKTISAPVSLVSKFAMPGTSLDFGELAGEIEKRGYDVNKPVTMLYFKDTGNCVVAEGNTRLKVMRSLGKKNIPIEIIIWSAEPEEYTFYAKPFKNFYNQAIKMGSRKRKSKVECKPEFFAEPPVGRIARPPIKQKFNKQGRITYEEWDNNTWIKWEYNSKGLLKHYEESSGYSEDYTYDKAGNMVSMTNNAGYMEKYNPMGRVIYRKFPDGGWIQYDDKGKRIIAQGEGPVGKVASDVNSEKRLKEQIEAMVKQGLNWSDISDWITRQIGYDKKVLDIARKYYTQAILR